MESPQTAVETHGHDEEHPPYLQHHFVDLDQQFGSAKLGMWLFLVTEILLFGGMFVAYSVFRAWHPETFFEAHEYLDVTLGAINTVVLLTSSLTVALAIRSIQVDDQRGLIGYLAATLLLAFVFLVIKYFEYTHKIHEGLLPGHLYTYAGGGDPYLPVFFGIYFVMTGIHGIHVLGGMGVMIWLIIKARRGAFSSKWYTPVEMGGLYWHVVDIIWIFLFPLLYLVE